jgi:hypothetical protein
MTLPFDLRGSLARLALASLLALALLPAGPAAAAQPGGAGLRAARAEERASRRAQHLQEAEARRAARAEERAGRRGRRQDVAGDEPPTSPSESETATPATRAYRGCSVSLAASSTEVTAGETVTLAGSLQCPSRLAATPRTVELYTRQASLGADALGTPTTVTAEADGSFTTTSAALSRNTVFHVRAGRHTARVAVKVAPAVTLTVQEPAPQATTASPRSHLRARAMFTGTVSPVVPGARVALQVAYAAAGENWHSVAFAQVLPDGTFAIPHGFRIAGEATVRAIVHLGRGYLVAVSEPLSYDVAAAQNAKLTILSSADPVAAGTAVTISGVEAGATGSPVKLLARDAAGRFSIVAESTTDGEGAYSFEVTPLADTAYRVLGTAGESATLFQGVTFDLAPGEAPTTAKAGTPLTLSGTLDPSSPGQEVYLEQGRADGIGFRVIATGTVTTGSQYTIEHTFAAAGTVLLRIKVPGDGLRVATAGAPFSLTVVG